MMAAAVSRSAGSIDPLDAFMADLDATEKQAAAEPDPLDAFMADIDATVRESETKARPRRDDLEDEDDQDTFFEEMAKGGAGPAGAEVAEDEGLDVPIPPLDHSEVAYEPLGKDFYSVHADIAKLSPAEVRQLREKLGIRATGADVPRPVASFAHLGFDDALMAAIRSANYTSPTAVQAQAMPAALQGRDVIAVAQTGSGKTAGFLLPMLVHLMDQRELEAGEGPIGIVLAPTRELAQQIHTEARRFGRVYGLSIALAVGGSSKWEQTKRLKAGAEILVATPGRLIDLIRNGAAPMRRASFLVLDEADRMFSLGFEPQIRSVLGQIRPDRQTLLFSATFPKRIEKLAREALSDPVRVTVGTAGGASTDVKQLVEVIGPDRNKWVWLSERLVGFLSAGSVLIFVTQKGNSSELAGNLRKFGHPGTLLLNGDMDQASRDHVIAEYKSAKAGSPRLLVATDVAARGLDIPGVRTVVNFDVARNIDTHVHRVGRTGRAGVPGEAYTLITPDEGKFAGELVRHLEQGGQPVPGPLVALANMNKAFRRARSGRGGARGGKLLPAPLLVPPLGSPRRARSWAAHSRAWVCRLRCSASHVGGEHQHVGRSQTAQGQHAD